MIYQISLKKLTVYFLHEKEVFRSNTTYLGTFFKECTLRRANVGIRKITGFNFSRSNIIHSKFANSIIRSPTFSQVKFTQAHFWFCEIEGLVFFEPSGDVTFENCQIKKFLAIKSSKFLVAFKNCYIHQCNIEGNSKSTSDKVEVSVINCTRIEKLILSELKASSDDSMIKIIDSANEQIHIHRSDIKRHVRGGQGSVKKDQSSKVVNI